MLSYRLDSFSIVLKWSVKEIRYLYVYVTFDNFKMPYNMKRMQLRNTYMTLTIILSVNAFFICPSMPKS